MTNGATLTAYDINRDAILNDGDQIALNNPNSPLPPKTFILGTLSGGLPPLPDFPDFPIGMPFMAEEPAFAPQPAEVDFLTMPNEGRASLPPSIG